MRVLVLTCAWLLGWVPNSPAEWSARTVPDKWEGEQTVWYRCWVKVPDAWTKTEGRDLWVESVTIGIEKIGVSHEVFVNGRKIGGGRDIGGRAHRYKVPPGQLQKAKWNTIAVRIHNTNGVGGFLGRAPSIQGYFLECVLDGEWEFREGDDEAWAANAVAEKPERATFETFKEASGILSEASQLMPGRRRKPLESFKMMKLEDDLSLKLLLHEPEVAQPTHLSFDARGRLWISQYRQYPYPSGLKMISRDKYYRAKYDREPQPPPNHNRGRSRISVHEDTTGNGHYDTHKVFLDGLDLANAALPDHDGVWVMHTPYLLFYPDSDQDDVPDGDPEVHLAGFGFEDTHSVANGLVWGPDGWIYGGQGSTVASRVTRPGIDEKGLYHEGCMVWRYEPESRRFEIFAEGGGNVFGLEFDAQGRLFSGHNGGNTRGWHYVQGGYLLKQGRSPNKFGPPANPYAFGDLPMMRGGKISRFSHATILCEGTALPERMRGCFLSADPLHHYLVLSDRVARGATFETKDLGFPLRCEDEGFRPVYLTNAPDGSVYVADFYEQYIAHGQHYQSQIDPSTGRVYRLEGVGTKREKDLDLRDKSTDELIALLSHPNKWHRQTAVRLLGHRKAGRQLVLSIRDHDSGRALHALWALHQAGGLTEDLAVEFLKHREPAVRMWCVRFLGDRNAISGGTADEIAILAKTESDLEVWSQLASTVQRLPADQGMPILSELLVRAGELQDPYLPLMFWWVIEKHCDDGRETVLAVFENPAIWRQPGVSREILPRLMRRFALQGRERDLLVCERLLRLAPGENERARLMLGFEQAFAGGGIPPLPDPLVLAMKELGAATPIIRLRSGEKDVIGEAVAIVVNARAEHAERLRFVRALGEIEPSEKTRKALLGLISTDCSADLKKAVFASLQRFEGVDVSEAVMKSYPSLTADVRPAAEALLASRQGWSRAWLKAIDEGAVPTEGIAVEAIATLRGYAELAELVRKHFGAAETVPPRPTPERVEQIRAIIEGRPGSPYRGRPLYKQLCGSCHVLFHEGGKIGPDLTSYQRDDLDTMLTSVLDPNAEVREGYEAVTITTKDGRTLTGFVADRGKLALSLKGFDGSDLFVRKTDVANEAPLGRSLMPAGLLDGLTDRQIRDLFAYLRIGQPFLHD